MSANRSIRNPVYDPFVLIYVTGVSGAGKSALCQELVTRGYDARVADDGISGWFRLADAREVPPSTGDDFLTPAWYSAHYLGLLIHAACCLCQ